MMLSSTTLFGVKMAVDGVTLTVVKQFNKTSVPKDLLMSLVDKKDTQRIRCLTDHWDENQNSFYFIH